MIPPSQEKAPWGWNLAFLMMNFEHILWKLLQTPCRWLEIYHNFALAQLTDKMDHMYIIPKEASYCHTDAHVKKNIVGHLGFLRKWQKNTFFSCFSASRPHRGLVVLMKTDGLITYWAQNFNFTPSVALFQIQNGCWNLSVYLRL